MSDDSSVDSDSGIRFKTDSTRNKEDSNRNKNTPSPDRRQYDRQRGFRGRSRSRDRWRGAKLNERRHLSRRSNSPSRRDRHNSPRRLTSRDNRSPSRRHSRASPRRNSRQSPKRDSRYSPRREGERRNSRSSLRRDHRPSPRREHIVSPRNHRDNDHRNYRKDRSHTPKKERRSSHDKKDRQRNKSHSQERTKQSSRSRRRDSSDCDTNLENKNSFQSGKRSRSPNGYSEKANKRHSSQRIVVELSDENKNHKRSRDRSQSKESMKRINENHNSKKQRNSPIISNKKGDVSLKANDSCKKLSSSSYDSKKIEQTQDLRKKLHNESQDGKSPSKEKNRNIDINSEEVESDSDVQPTSYYNLITVDEVEDSQTEAVELDDSSEDEKVLRDKLLILEKELRKTKEKKKLKHKDKKHRRSIKKSRHSTDDEVPQKCDEIISISPDVKITRNVNTDETNEKKLSSNENKSSVSNKKLTLNKNNPSPEKNVMEEQVKLISEKKTVSNDVQRSKKANANESREEGEIISDKDEAEDPDARESVLDKSLVAGPALPPHLKNKFEKNDAENQVNKSKLPPQLKKEPDDRIAVVGPTLPDDMRDKLARNSIPESHSDHSDGDSSETDGIGPLPEGSEHKWSKAHQSLEERALIMKLGVLEDSQNVGTEAVSREEWMLELPEAKAKQLGLGPRQFRAREAPDLSDRSSWTDTPKDKALKAAGVVPEKETTSSDTIKEEAQKKFISERDEQQEIAVKKHKKKHSRGESLLEQHQKKMKKKKKKEEKEAGGKVRRPFDRNIDLGVNRFDEAQKKSIIKKAQLLDSRFSGGESKFL